MSRMDWQDDPIIQQQLRARSVRNGILRSAILWTPPFLASAGALLFFLFDVITGPNHGGTWFLVIVLLVFAVLFGSQCVQAWLDLRASPVTKTGMVTRRWSRNDSIVMRSHYIRLDTKQILRGDPDFLMDVKEGDSVQVSFYRHSAVIAALEKLKPPPEPGDQPGT
jgi:hypothetical protein